VALATDRIARQAVALGCAYEIVAIETGWVPTITRLYWQWRTDRRLVVVLMLAWSYLTWHLLVEAEKEAQR
jgi:hypothetical protein